MAAKEIRFGASARERIRSRQKWGDADAHHGNSMPPRHNQMPYGH